MSDEGDKKSPSEKKTLLDEETLEEQVPLKPKSDKKKNKSSKKNTSAGGNAAVRNRNVEDYDEYVSDDSSGSFEDDDEFANDGAFGSSGDDEYESYSSGDDSDAGSWDSCSTDEWMRPQPHDTIRVAGSKTIFGVMIDNPGDDGEWDYEDEREHGEANDARTATFDRGGTYNDEEDLERMNNPDEHNAFLALPLVSCQVTAEEYVNEICKDSVAPKPLPGDDLALRRVRAPDTVEVIDRTVDCGVVYSLPGGEHGIAINATIDALVSPLSFQADGAPESMECSSLATLLDKKEPRQGKKRWLMNPNTPISFKELGRFGRGENPGAAPRPGEHLKQGSDRPGEWFPDWTRRVDQYHASRLPMGVIGGEQFFVANPFRTGALVLYDGPESGIDRREPTSAERAEDESNFGFVRTCGSHALLKLKVTAACDDDAPFDITGYAPTEAGASGSILVAMDCVDVLDTNFEICSESRPLDRDHEQTDSDADSMDDDNRLFKTLPSYVDPIGPGTLAEKMNNKKIAERCTFIFGTPDDLKLVKDESGGASSSGKKGGKKSKKGFKKQSLRPPEGFEGARVDAVIVAVYPHEVTAANEVSGLPKKFFPWELLTMESFRGDNCLVGRVGFAMPTSDAFLESAKAGGGRPYIAVETSIGRVPHKARPAEQPTQPEPEPAPEVDPATLRPKFGDVPEAEKDAEDVRAYSAAIDTVVQTENSMRIETQLKESGSAGLEHPGSIPFDDMKNAVEAIFRDRQASKKGEAEEAAEIRKAASESSSHRWVPNHFKNYAVRGVVEAAEAGRKLYTDTLGILFTREEALEYFPLDGRYTNYAKEKKMAFWRRKVAQLQPHIDYLVTINATFSSVDLVLRDGTIKHSVPSPMLLEAGREVDKTGDLFPMDLVMPTRMQFAELKRQSNAFTPWGLNPTPKGEQPTKYADISDELLGEADDAVMSKAMLEAGDGPMVQALHSGELPVFNLQLVNDYEMELQTSEVVYIRRKSDKLFESPLVEINGDEGVGQEWYEKDQPSIMGVVLSCDAEEQTAEVRWVKQHPDLRRARQRYGYMAGEVLELLPNTKARVLWQDGTVADMWRGELSVILDLESDDEGDDDWEEDFGSDGNRSDDGSSVAEAEAHADDVASPSDVPEMSGDDDNEPADEDEKAKDEAKSGGGLRSALTGALSGIASTFSAIGRAARGGDGENEAAEDPVTPPREEQIESDDEEDLSNEEVLGDAGEGEGLVGGVPAGKFSVVSMFSSHWFKDHENDDVAQLAAGGSAAGPREALRVKRIRNEWKKLRANPPPGVIVKICDEDASYLKFAIVGPMHTPYFQSLLCFDAYFPADFPNVPPKVHFHSYAMRLNPNLYENGHICLSLLGTWEGTQSSEGWMPATSTFLQVILSIQSLVLVKEPFYNEAGFESKMGTQHGRTLSKAYNETLQLQRLSHMQQMVEAPPSDWGYEIRNHFTRFAPLVSTRLKRVLAAAAKQRREGEGKEPATGVTADGVVLPVARGFAVALESAVASVDKLHATKVPEWEAAFADDLDRFDTDE